MKIHVTDYDELRNWFTDFAGDSYDIMIVEGSAGTGKSQIARESIKNLDPKDYCFLEGRISAVCLYEKLYRHRDQPIYIDDVDGLYADRQCVNLLKCVCQTNADKTVMWNTRGIKNMPADFTTRSKVCIITNNWRALNKHVGAVEDRGILIPFHPTPYAVHDYVGNNLIDCDWFDDEIFIFIGELLPVINNPSIRHYRNCKQIKNAGRNWRAVMAESCGLNETEALVLKLLVGGVEGQRVSFNELAHIFAQIADRSTRTFWRIKAEFAKKGLTCAGEAEIPADQEDSVNGQIDH